MTFTRAERRNNKRSALMHQLGGQCIKCGSVLGLEIDHITPILVSNNKTRAKELGSNIDNLQLLCILCHQAKTKQEFS